MIIFNRKETAKTITVTFRYWLLFIVVGTVAGLPFEPLWLQGISILFVVVALKEIWHNIREFYEARRQGRVEWIHAPFRGRYAWKIHKEAVKSASKRLG